MMSDAVTSSTSNSEDPGKGMGIASLVLSLIGVHLIGLILGIIGLSQSKKAKKTNGMAIAGIIISSLGMLVGLIVIIAIIAGAGKTTNSTSTLKVSHDTVTSQPSTSSNSTAKTSGKTYRFDDRADKQASDIEVAVNEAATIDGMKMTVDSVSYSTSLSDYETADAGKTYLVAKVSFKNTSTKTKPYNQYDFRVQTNSGQVLDPTFSISLTNALNSADLVTGGSVSGEVVFELPVEDAHQYLIWKPGFESTRAIIQAK